MFVLLCRDGLVGAMVLDGAGAHIFLAESSALSIIFVRVWVDGRGGAFWVVVVVHHPSIVGCQVWVVFFFFFVVTSETRMLASLRRFGS